jgi:hypothetical protein
MIKILFSFCLILLSSCATKYIVPGNRFLTPESQGGTFHGQAEFQQTTGSQLTIQTSNGTVDEGVFYSDSKSSGFLASESIFNNFDVVWSHIASGNSMLGGKFQIIGGSRIEKQTGHKASLGILFGGNEHETDNMSVEFQLSGREYLFLYGYRISENVFPYAGLSLASYNFSGVVSTDDPITNGLRPNMVTDIHSLSGGVEFSLDSLFAKLEASYQQLMTTDTKMRSLFVVGYSVGYAW